MMSELGFDNLGYIAIQRMGSHAVHGTWTGLLVQNVEPGAKGRNKGSFNEVHPNDRVALSFIALDAIRAFINLVAKRSDRKRLTTAIAQYHSKLVEHSGLMAEPDLKPVE
jgi:hypothetical protein